MDIQWVFYYSDIYCGLQVLSLIVWITFLSSNPSLSPKILCLVFLFCLHFSLSWCSNIPPGPIPSTLTKLLALNQVQMHDNQLTGSLPDQLATTILNGLGFGGNQLVGKSHFFFFVLFSLGSRETNQFFDFFFFFFFFNPKEQSLTTAAILLTIPQPFFLCLTTN